VNSSIIRSPLHTLMCGYLLLVALAATLAPVGSLSADVLAGNTGGTDIASATTVGLSEPGAVEAVAPATENTPPPACVPELSLAGRELAFDPVADPHLGTLQFPDVQPLRDKEVLLTFDDGPHPHRTVAILDILDRFCVKAVFFSVGEMALEYPDVLREVAKRGHVIGTHSYSHPRSLARLGHDRAKAEIDMGFAAVVQALGGPVSPLFRFPGFNQTPYLLDYLAEKKLSVWSVDVVSGDSEFVGSQHLPSVLFRRLEAHGRGIILFHDLKKATTDRLADILQRLKDEGYTAVRPSFPATFKPDDAMLATLAQGKPRWTAPVRRAVERSGSARVAIRSSARFQRVRRVPFEFQEQ
jgi:peptidoglycan/xylan/chitin deacetylase (PgdA/CDA1 family)